MAVRLDSEPQGSARGAAADGEVGRMAGGTVKQFSGEEGYGFITPDGGGEDIYVHFTAIEGFGIRSLQEGERVSYEPGESRRGEIAANVRKVS